MTSPRLIVIGASRAGVDALAQLLEVLPGAMPPIAVVVHGGDDVSPRLARHTALAVVEPDDKTPLEPGHVYVAPADYHLLVEGGALALSTEGPVEHARPSIDVLFESAADAWGEGLVAVLLDATSEDGVAGAGRVRARGGTVVVPDTRVADADHVLSLDRIAAFLAEAAR